MIEKLVYDKPPFSMAPNSVKFRVAGLNAIFYRLKNDQNILAELNSILQETVYLLSGFFPNAYRIATDLQWYAVPDWSDTIWRGFNQPMHR